MNNNNKTAKQIEKMYNDLKEAIRHNLSLKLMDTSVEKPLSVDITLADNTPDLQGFSELQKIKVEKIYQDPSSGEIGVFLDLMRNSIDFDLLDINDQIQIVKEIENTYEKV